MKIISTQKPPQTDCLIAKVIGAQDHIYVEMFNQSDASRTVTLIMTPYETAVLAEKLISAVHKHHQYGLTELRRHVNRIAKRIGLLRPTS